MSTLSTGDGRNRAAHRVYGWEPGWGPDEQAIRPAPAWVVELLRPSTAPVAVPDGRAGTAATTQASR